MTKQMLGLVTLLVWAALPVLRAADDAEANKAKIPGLKLWLKLAEPEGKKAKNAVEKGVDCEVEGATWVKEGKIGGALSFSGDNQYILTAASLHEAFAEGNLTIAVWINAKGGGVVADELGQHELEGGWHDSQIEVMDDGEVKVRVWQLDPLSIGKVKLNEWHHVVVRFNAKTQTLDGCVDGVKAADKQTGEKQWHDGGDIYYAFGAADSTNCGQGGFFKGQMSDIRIYNRALTDDEVKILAGVQK
ncbi:MAG: LamG domain-containing protein [Planctomycetota bacterium]